MTSKISKKGFSLIELSIVLIVLAILFASVTQGSKMLKQAKLTTAKASTQSAPVSVISGLVLWLEIASDDSLLSAEADEMSSVSIWKDINNLALSKANVSQTTGGNKPFYNLENGINGLPALRFTAANSTFLNTALAGTTGNVGVPSSGSFSVIAVIKSTNVTTAADFISVGTANSAATGWSIGITASGALGFRINGAAMAPSTATLSANTPAIVTMTYDATNAIFYKNGTSVPSVAAANLATVATPDVTIGATNNVVNNPWSGDIAEIIVYNKVLKAQERKDIEAYLSGKYSIKVSSL